MDEIVKKFSLAADKFMPEMHLRQPRYTYKACGPFTKKEERIDKFIQTGNTDFIYRNELIQHTFSMVWLIVKQKIW